uniref:Methionyl-tRNA formyltransferase n=1 Tax=candidate division CPR3 bacterium TaxID=2268181 RepID=A0A7C4M1K0_UNCC3
MDLEKIKIIYFGTPEFSARILQDLLDAGFNIVGVVTESDKPVGRSQEVAPCAVKRLATENGIRIINHESPLRESFEGQARIMNEELRELKPDICVVAAYGKILKKETLEIPKYGFINFHPSLLPQLRGASPIQSAILQGIEKTGVSIIKMDEGMDSGPILSQVEIPIDKEETTLTLQNKSLKYGIPLLIKTISEYVLGKIEPSEQNESEITYCKKITKEDGKIDFNKSAEEEYKKFRAYIDWPGSYCWWGEKRVKIFNIKYSILNIKGKSPGKVFLDGDGNLCLMFSDGYWIVDKLQLEGKKPMSAKEFLNGNKDFIDSLLK